MKTLAVYFFPGRSTFWIKVSLWVILRSNNYSTIDPAHFKVIKELLRRENLLLLTLITTAAQASLLVKTEVGTTWREWYILNYERRKLLYSRISTSQTMIMISSSVLIYHYKNFSIECLYFLSFLLGATFVSSPDSSSIALLLYSYYYKGTGYSISIATLLCTIQ